MGRLYMCETPIKELEKLYELTYQTLSFQFIHENRFDEISEWMYQFVDENSFLDSIKDEYDTAEDKDEYDEFQDWFFETYGYDCTFFIPLLETLSEEEQQIIVSAYRDIIYREFFCGGMNDEYYEELGEDNYFLQ